jgi:hypothetical protein
LWARSCLLVHAGKSLLEFSDTFKSDIPSGLELTGNQAFGRIYSFVSARR